MEIKELMGRYPITISISSYFALTFIGTGSVAFMFDRPLSEAAFISILTALTGAVVGWVKAIDNDTESE